MSVDVVHCLLGLLFGDTLQRGKCVYDYFMITDVIVISELNCAFSFCNLYFDITYLEQSVFNYLPLLWWWKAARSISATIVE